MCGTTLHKPACEAARGTTPTEKTPCRTMPGSSCWWPLRRLLRPKPRSPSARDLDGGEPIDRAGWDAASSQAADGRAAADERRLQAGHRQAGWPPLLRYFLLGAPQRDGHRRYFAL